MNKRHELSLGDLKYENKLEIIELGFEILDELRKQSVDEFQNEIESLLRIQMKEINKLKAIKAIEETLGHQLNEIPGYPFDYGDFNDFKVS